MVLCSKPCFSSKLHYFLDGGKVSKLIDLVSLEEASLAYVIGCFFGVVQGVDIVCDDQSKNDPRLFLLFNLCTSIFAVHFVSNSLIVFTYVGMF
jgi:hypothetical protein